MAPDPNAVLAALPALSPVAYCSPADVSRFRDGETLDADIKARAIADATDVMWAATGRQFAGPVTVKIRPCCYGDLCGGANISGNPFDPQLIHGQWYNLGPFGIQGVGCVVWECGQAVPRIDLDVFPVRSAVVMIDGVVFDPAKMRIDDNRFLTRLDGQLWPTSQNLLKPDTQPGTWSVAVIYGWDPLASIVNATAELACELGKHRQTGQCALPLGKISTINRQGITYALPDVAKLVASGATGLFFVDMAVKAANPAGLARPPRIASLDRRPPHVVN